MASYVFLTQCRTELSVYLLYGCSCQKMVGDEWLQLQLQQEQLPSLISLGQLELSLYTASPAVPAPISALALPHLCQHCPAAWLHFRVAAAAAQQPGMWAELPAVS